MMETKECGKANWAIAEAARCFAEDMGYPVCCMNIRNPAIHLDEHKTERDWVYDAITKANPDEKKGGLSWCTNTPDNCTESLKGQVLWNMNDLEDL